MTRGTCSVCGQVCGGHFAGCPEDEDEDELETPEIGPDPEEEDVE